jgi:hypothetical protein
MISGSSQCPGFLYEKKNFTGDLRFDTALFPNRRAEVESFKKRTWMLEKFILRVVNIETLDVETPAANQGIEEDGGL